MQTQVGSILINRSVKWVDYIPSITGLYLWRAKDMPVGVVAICDRYYGLAVCGLPTGEQPLAIMHHIYNDMEWASLNEA